MSELTSFGPILQAGAVAMAIAAILGLIALCARIIVIVFRAIRTAARNLDRLIGDGSPEHPSILAVVTTTAADVRILREQMTAHLASPHCPGAHPEPAGVNGASPSRPLAPSGSAVP